MARRPLPAATLLASPDDVEAQFYEALQRGDIDKLMAVWADDDEVVCVHPGGGRIIGPAAIRASFEAIFANGGIPVQVEQVHRLQYQDSALHHLVEKVQVAGADGQQQVAWVMTTNFYVKTALGWRLASHHASPGTLKPPGPGTAVVDGDGPNTLH